MPTSNPDTWTSPAWHADFGNAEAETVRLRAFAKTLLTKCPQVEVNLEEPEEGYLYVQVVHHSKTIAEVYCVREPGTDTLRYGVFILEGDHEDEHYCSTESEAVKVIEPLLN